jgi:hypothetical protein
MLENAAEFHQSAARFIGRFVLSKTRYLKKDHNANHNRFE